ncbi:ATP-dependent DNA helicase srs2-like [Dorcoceras hygrometricum]|uniref:ATP-dependent DNA helicase srs2-like n=1 Tax=Dorcoceras hygrometricum TaxID=472368 RepID=A0A2Z7B234_9LAMI|nr:ATP-dependent DNA helicase srs2-like [Dorcoceras hygrometricum]
MVSVKYDSFISNIPIESMTIESIGYPRTSANGESSTAKHRLLYASRPHPIPSPGDLNGIGKRVNVRHISCSLNDVSSRRLSGLPRWHLCLAPTGVSRTRLFSVDCGSLRQSGPRPDPRLLRQAALESLTRSARTNTPRKTGPEQFPTKLVGGGGGAWGGGGDGFAAADPDPAPVESQLLRRFALENRRKFHERNLLVEMFETNSDGVGDDEGKRGGEGIC